MPSTKVSASSSKGKREAKRGVDPEEFSADESEPKIARVDEADETKPAEKRGFLEFLAKASIPCPEVKFSPGGKGSANAEGIVISSQKSMVQNRNGMSPKVMLTILIKKIMPTAEKRNDNVVTTGVPGFAFGFPSKQLEASPEEIAKDPNAKGPIVIDTTKEDKLAYLGIISTSFYTDSKSAKTGKKGNSSEDISSAEACTPGTRVLVSGITNVFAKDSKGQLKVYTNAKDITPLQASVPAGLAAANLIEEACSPMVQETASLLLSSCMYGFFDVSYDQQSLSDQAQCFKKKWASVIHNTAVKLDSIAASQTGDNAETTKDIVLAHANRVRAINPSEAAQGMHIFNCDMQKDCVTPYVAPIVQRGVKPGDTHGYMVKELTEGQRLSLIPTSFCEALVSSILIDKNLIKVFYRLFLVGDKNMALESAVTSNPIICTENAGTCVKLAKTTFGPSVLGTVVSSKIEMGINEMMYTMDHVAMAPVFPHSADSMFPEGHFTPTVGYDVVDGISKVGIAVSKEWIDTNMLGGRGVLIHKHADDAELVEPAANAGPTPSLSKQFYQAISEGSFDFDSLKPPDGKKTYFYVVYSGCFANVKNTPALSLSVDEGERHLEDIVAATREDGDIKTFLKDVALVYAVAA